ncbi:MAG TPA: hypothetical protein VHL08_00985 [Dongiaceae bacterium]|jgi:hypothetical protein|nr:hypothetical protein [Dongiaceae bacterium]
MNMNFLKSLKNGLIDASKDYMSISSRDLRDVKPKEDQIKCALYAHLRQGGYSVHVEGAYQSRGRCDLRAYQNDGSMGDILIEIKTAWAGPGWVNKQDEQFSSWEEDCGRLRDAIAERDAESGVFILFGFASETLSEKLCARMAKLGEKLQLTEIIKGNTSLKWGTLDHLHYCAWRINA